MKNKEQNIERFLQNKPELTFIISVLSGKSVIENEVKQSANNLDHNEFIRLIKHHRLDSIFYKTVKDQNIELPVELDKKLADIDKKNRMRMMKLTAELIRIHKLFTENGIDYISLKGPALSQQIYGDYTIRSSRDLDILVKVEDLGKVNLLLKNIGYYTDTKNFSKHQKAHHDIIFINAEKKLKVEIHERLFSFNNLFKYSNEELFNNTDSVLINNIKIPVLSNKTNHNYLFVHAEKHSWELLYWIFDLYKSTTKNDLNNLLNKFACNSKYKKNRLLYYLYLLFLRKDFKYKYSLIVVHLERLKSYFLRIISIKVH